MDMKNASNKLSAGASVEGNLSWKPAKFVIGHERGSIIVEVNTANRTWMEQNHAALDTAYWILKAKGLKMVTSIKRIPVFPGETAGVTLA